MDEARLKEIEATVTLIGWAQVRTTQKDWNELIAALRHAWQERGDWYSKWDHARRGYERVKADLIHKDAVIKALQQQYVDHMKPLVALRSAAEDYFHMDENGCDPAGVRKAILRRALDACRE